MDDGLKQRIIGAFVLLAIAIIFVPVFFDRERIAPVDRQTIIPPAPSIEPVVIDRPVPTEVAEPAKPVEEMFVPEVVEATPTPAPKPQKQTAGVGSESKPGVALTEQGVPQGWVLQVASYQSSERAAKMRDELIAGGYSAYIREITTNGETMSRVYIGPKLDRKKLEQEKAALDKQYQINTLLLKFDP